MSSAAYAELRGSSLGVWAWLRTRLASDPASQLLVLLLASLALRVTMFGHPNMDDDEAFYALVGQEMHRGALPYVDIWDRKPLGLFLLYYMFAGISDSPLVYQVAAWISVALTSWVIARLVTGFCNGLAGIFAGASYCAALPYFWGWGGQAPVFYNLLIAAAALLITTSLDRDDYKIIYRRIYIAMLLCGLAITIKQTTVFESAFFGLYCASFMYRRGISIKEIAARATRWMIIGAIPMLLIAGYYWLAGHWSEFWHAMITSNLAKQGATGATLAARGINIYQRLWPLLCVMLLALLLKSNFAGSDANKKFLMGWLIAAWIGFFSVPNIYVHYALPLLVPMSAASGFLLGRKDLGLIAFVFLSYMSLTKFDFTTSEHNRRAQFAFKSMAKSIKDHGGNRGLLIFDGPVSLYSITGNRPLSPLALPSHFNYQIENDVSHLSTITELSRVLDTRPGVVLLAQKPRNNPVNQAALDMVTRYVVENCQLVNAQPSSTVLRSDIILVYGDCSPRAH